MVNYKCEVGLGEIAEVIEDRHSNVVIAIEEEHLRHIEITVLFNDSTTDRPQQRYTDDPILLCLHERYLDANRCKSIESYI